MTEEKSGEDLVRHIPARQRHISKKVRTFSPLLGDPERKVFARRRQREAIAAAHVEKGRDMEGLVRLMLGRTVLGDRRNIGVSVAERVVDFMDHAAQIAFRAVAEVKRDGIEFIAEDTRRAEQAHRAALQRNAGVGKARARPLEDRRPVPGAMIALMEGVEIEPVDRKPAIRRRRLVQAGQIDHEKRHAIAETMPEGRGSLVDGPAFIKAKRRRMHGANPGIRRRKICGTAGARARPNRRR